MQFEKTGYFLEHCAGHKVLKITFSLKEFELFLKISMYSHGDAGSSSNAYIFLVFF